MLSWFNLRVFSEGTRDGETANTGILGGAPFRAAGKRTNAGRLVRKPGTTHQIVQPLAKQGKRSRAGWPFIILLYLIGYPWRAIANAMNRGARAKSSLDRTVKQALPGHIDIAL